MAAVLNLMPATMKRVETLTMKYASMMTVLAYAAGMQKKITAVYVLVIILPANYNQQK